MALVGRRVVKPVAPPRFSPDGISHAASVIALVLFAKMAMSLPRDRCPPNPRQQKRQSRAGFPLKKQFQEESRLPPGPIPAGKPHSMMFARPHHGAWRWRPEKQVFQFRGLHVGRFGMALSGPPCVLCSPTRNAVLRFPYTPGRNPYPMEAGDAGEPDLPAGASIKPSLTKKIISANGPTARSSM